MTLIGNPEPMMDKIFTNIEFRACVDGEGSMVTGEDGKERYMPSLPFDYTEAWNEYQHGQAVLSNKHGHALSKHFYETYRDGDDIKIRDIPFSLKRKFRIWRCDIPRDNAGSSKVWDDTFDYTVDDDGNHPWDPIQRNRYPQDRLRNTWIYLKMFKGAAEDETVIEWDGPKTVYHSLPRAEMHDMVMTYFT
jgi:hypothetical protein